MSIFLPYAKFMHFLMLSNISVYLILTKIAYQLFFCDGLNEKNILFFKEMCMTG